MDLTNLSRGDLAELQGRLRTVATAADALAEGGLEPVIDLTDAETRLRAGPVREAPWVARPSDDSDGAGLPPGAGVGVDLVERRAFSAAEVAWLHMSPDARSNGGNVFLPVEMAEAEDAEADWPLTDAADDPGPVVIEDLRKEADAAADDELAQRLEAALEEENPGEAEAKPPLEPAGEQAAEAPPPEEMEDPAPVPAAPEPPAAATGTVAAVEAPARPGGNPPAGAGGGASDQTAMIWTAKEDARLVDLIAVQIAMGATKSSAVALAAQELGRPFEGARWRVNTKLKDRVAQAVAAIRAPVVVPGTVPPTSEPVAAPPVVAAPADVVAPEPAVPAPAPRARAFRPAMPDGLSGAHRRIWSWLDGLDYTADFGPGDDLFVVESFAKGVKAPMLAVDMGVDTKALLDRYRALTQPIRNERDHIQPDLQGKLAEVLRLRKAAFAKAQAA